jgi:hypothetical protein
MFKRLIIVLISHRHKLLDLIYIIIVLLFCRNRPLIFYLLSYIEIFSIALTLLRFLGFEVLTTVPEDVPIFWALKQ